MAGNRSLISRRYWLRSTVSSLAATTGLLARRQTVTSEPLMAAQDFAQYPSVITPNSDFFVRNHFAQPSIDVSSWDLRVEGAVKNPRRFHYKDLESMKQRTLTAVLECAGNGVGEGFVGCAAWSGPLLSDVLRECGLADGARCVRFVAADQGTESDAEGRMPYARSIAIDKAMQPETLLALQMNGARLPPENGFPIRLMRAGSYGMDAVKWLEKIVVLEAPDDSFFTTQRYLRLTNSATAGRDRVDAVQIKSMIVQPAEAAILHGTNVELGGYAWAGREPVQRVEVSVDKGASWRRTQLLESSQPFAWTPWKLLWERVQPGIQTVSVRAFSESNQAQPSSRNRARLDKYELNHYHQVTFRVLA